MTKIKSPSRIIFCFLFLLAACGQLTEDEKFEQFFQQYEKMSAKQVFTDLETSPSKTIPKSGSSENELRLAISFCNKNLDKLDGFDYKKLSPENRGRWKVVFSELKEQLKKIEKKAAAGKPSPKLKIKPKGVVE